MAGSGEIRARRTEAGRRPADPGARPPAGPPRVTDLPGVEGAIEALASRQHGVLTRRQLVAAGMGADMVDRRVKAKRLRRLHRGVYAVAPQLPPHGREMAACLACGPRAVLSHRSAAILWQLLRAPSRPASIDVLLPSGNRRHPGLRIRRIRTVRPDEITQLYRIPVTTVERTLLDLAACVAPRKLEQALALALARNLTRPDRVEAILARHEGEPGAPALRSLLEGRTPPGAITDGRAASRRRAASRPRDDSRPRAASRPRPTGRARHGAALTRSEAEERFLVLVRAAGIEEPEVNVVIEGYEVDFFWRPERLVTEIDGFAYHSTRSAFEADRRRDAALAAAGYRVTRVTWHQIAREPEAVLVRLARALAVAVS